MAGWAAASSPGTALQQQVAAAADRWAFLVHNLWKPPGGAGGAGAARP